MKRNLAIIGLSVMVVLAVSSCRPKAGQGVKWDVKELKTQYAGPEDEVDISCPVAVEGKAAGAINTHVEQAVAEFVGYPDLSAQAALDSLFSEKAADTILSKLGYSVIIFGEVYTYGSVGTVVLNNFQYTGGAHGLGVTTCIAFETHTGHRLELRDMFNDVGKLAEINREAFSRIFAENEPDFVETMFIPVDDLPMPNNAAIDEQGLHVFYNVYELAPYSSGAVQYLVPMDDIKHLLNKKIFR